MFSLQQIEALNKKCKKLNSWKHFKDPFTKISIHNHNLYTIFGCHTYPWKSFYYFLVQFIQVYQNIREIWLLKILILLNAKMLHIHVFNCYNVCTLLKKFKETCYHFPIGQSLYFCTQVLFMFKIHFLIQNERKPKTVRLWFDKFHNFDYFMILQVPVYYQNAACAKTWQQ